MKTLIQCVNIEHRFHTTPLLKKQNIHFYERARVGIVGRNGSGKSTLLKIIAGILEPDNGTVTYAKNINLAYVPQNRTYPERETILEHVLRRTHTLPHYARETLLQCGFSTDEHTRNANSYSDGYKMRLEIAVLIAQQPNCLLLDEPTNYLDLESIIFLETFLRSFMGTLILVTHDRMFMNNLCATTYGIEDGMIYTYNGTVDAYFADKHRRETSTRTHNATITQKQQHLQRYIDRFGRISSKASQAISKEKYIKRLESQKEGIPQESEIAHIVFKQEDTRSVSPLTLTSFSGGYTKDSYILKNITIHIEARKQYILVGNNGVGKSTLLQALYGSLPYTEGIIKIPKVGTIGYYTPIHAGNTNKQSVSDYVQSMTDISYQELRALCDAWAFNYEHIHSQIDTLSGGERARLELMILYATPKNILFLDEPTNHLDIETVESLGYGLQKYTGTLILVSHDRSFCEHINPHVIEIKNGKVTVLPYRYKEYLDRIQPLYIPIT